MRRSLRVVLVLFLTYHACGLVISLIPDPSALAGRLHPLFSDYHRLTGNTQTWAMFTTLPNRQSSRVSAWSMDASGVRREHGAILPGLRRYDAEETFRFHSLFERLSTPAFSVYLPAYACKVADQIEGTLGERPIQIELVMTSKRIRYLRDIRSGGGSTFDQVWTSDPFEVARCGE